MIDNFTDEQLKQVFTMLNSVKKMLDNEMEDDLFCEKMLDDYLNDSDPEKHKSITLDEFIKELGLNPDEL